MGQIVFLAYAHLIPIPLFIRTWAKTFGGIYSESSSAIRQTVDGGYILAGYTQSSWVGGYGAYAGDAFVLKLDGSGIVVWQKAYGGTSTDRASSIYQTTDGGFIVAGSVLSYGVGSSGGGAWVLKLDANGAIVWQKTYGGAWSDEANSIQQTVDGGYILAGSTKSYGAGVFNDLMVLRLDARGNTVWQKVYGGGLFDWAGSIQQTADGGFVVAGSTNSYTVDSNYDAWVLKLDANGSVVWQKAYGGASSDTARFIQQTVDGGYILAGHTRLYGTGATDIWVLKLNKDGDIAVTCPSGMGSNFSIASSSTSMTPMDSSFVPSTPSITQLDTNAVPANTYATVISQCTSP